MAVLEDCEEVNAIWKLLTFRIVWKERQEPLVFLEEWPHSLDGKLIEHRSLYNFNLVLLQYIFLLRQDLLQVVFVHMRVWNKVELH